MKTKEKDVELKSVKGMRNINNYRIEKGITLVALIITIIVLIILIVISVNEVLDLNIIDLASNNIINNALTHVEEENEMNDIDNLMKNIVKRLKEKDHIIDEDITKEPTVKLPIQDGSYEITKKVNTPKITETGLIPVYYNGIKWIELNETSTEEEWNKWYDYDNKHWANAKTIDGSMWVWIPRYEYKIDNVTKTIDINFIPTTQTTGKEGYFVHPAFTTDIENGGWDKDISGFWIAKYAAGFQNTDIKEMEYSNKTYQTSQSTGTYLGTITNGITKMSYPVFKQNTYVYNYISVGDAYILSQEIKNAKRYGLSNVDSHLEKNSEWGAVVYLTHSKYGLNGEEVTPNRENLENKPTGIYSVTSYGKKKIPNDILASSTHDITGVFDLSGGIWERTSTFLSGGKEIYVIGMPIETSSKYVTIYKGDNKRGDATNETANWNKDYAYFISSNYPVFARGGYYSSAEAYCGIFAYYYNAGSPSQTQGFRTVLIS